MARVCHVIFKHTPFDGRVFHKEILTLAEAGHEMILAVPHLNRHSLGRRREVPLESVPGLARDGVRLLPYPYIRKIPRRWNLRRWFCRRALLKKLAACRADIFHFHEDGLVLETAAAFKRYRPDAKLVFDYHESYRDQYAEDADKRRKNPGMEEYEAAMLRQADLLVTVSDVLTERYRQRADCPVVTVMNAQSAHRFEPRCNRLPDDGSFWMVHEGSPKFDRGLEMMLQTARLTDPGVKWLFIGALPKKEMRCFEEFTGRHGIRDRFLLTGQLPYEEVPEYLAGADLGVYFRQSANAQTGIANKFFNYLRFGIPVISVPNRASDPYMEKYGLGPVVAGGDAVAAAEAINGLYHDRSRHEALREHARHAFREELNWETMGKRLVDAYGRLA